MRHGKTALMKRLREQEARLVAMDKALEDAHRATLAEASDTALEAETQKRRYAKLAASLHPTLASLLNAANDAIAHGAMGPLIGILSVRDFHDACGPVGHVGYHEISIATPVGRMGVQPSPFAADGRGFVIDVDHRTLDTSLMYGRQGIGMADVDRRATNGTPTDHR